jgi:NAD-specific glutamate dehydrogenase
METTTSQPKIKSMRFLLCFRINQDKLNYIMARYKISETDISKRVEALLKSFQRKKCRTLASEAVYRGVPEEIALAARVSSANYENKTPEMIRKGFLSCARKSGLPYQSL